MTASTSQSRSERRVVPGRSEGGHCTRRSVGPRACARPPTKVDPIVDRRPRCAERRRPKLWTMIVSEGLTKRLGGRTVVHDVSFRCEPGTVTGFLGPNGAGKTTTLRMLCGLSEPDAGRSTVLGARYRDIEHPGRRVGILLDASAQHAGRRGREALAVSAQTMGVEEKRVDELLDLVGLEKS